MSGTSSRKSTMGPLIPQLNIDELNLSRSRYSNLNPQYSSAFPNKLPPGTTLHVPGPPDSQPMPRLNFGGNGRQSTFQVPSESLPAIRSPNRRQTIKIKPTEKPLKAKESGPIISQDRLSTGISGDDSMMTMFIAEKMGRKLKKTADVVQRQESAINRMMETQERLLSEISEQRRVNTEFELKFNRNRHQASFETPRISESREKAYRNLTMLNRLGESMARNEYGFDFFTGGPAFQTMPDSDFIIEDRSHRLKNTQSMSSLGNNKSYSNSPLIKGATESLLNQYSSPRSFREYGGYQNSRIGDSGGYLLNSVGSPRRDYPSGPVLPSPKGYESAESARSNEFYFPERVSTLPSIPEKKKKKKKKQSDFMEMLPIIMMSQMSNAQEPKEDKLLKALDSQNKILASLSNDMGNNSRNGYDSEKKILEKKIEELEHKIKGNSKGGVYFFFDCFLWTNCMGNGSDE